MPTITLDHLRRYAVARTLWAPTTLAKAIERLGFVQMDPLRAPARAQDLMLRHRVRDYRAGDLEARYPGLAIEEDFFINYGVLPRSMQALMHPRTPSSPWPKRRQAQAAAVLDFVRERGVVHPREVDERFRHGKVRNWFGGSSNASTTLLDSMHYRGLLRVARRHNGIRLYAARDPHSPPMAPEHAMPALADIIVRQYAPLPATSLSQLVMFLRGAAPQWDALRAPLARRLKATLPQVQIDGVSWLWPEGEHPAASRHAPRDEVRLLAPFDPIVWDRRRFERLWGWAYRFEAYTPAARRIRGHYALPLLWRDRVIGWGNLGVVNGALVPDLGYVDGAAPRDAAFRAALDDELQRIGVFLRL